jgi:NAD(P)-dependent dehydrogenase (short-subunit alcohol dehydrogenase family)
MIQAAPTSQRFADKVVLVTGGGSGIGRATAVAFGTEGATVVVSGRNLAPLEETVRLVEKAGGTAAAAVADVTSSADLATLVDAIARDHGGLHVAFNNAGTLDGVGMVADIDEAAWNRIVTANLTGTWLSMKHEIGYMTTHGGGVIVNMCSVIGPHITLPYMGAYSATKAAISSLTRTAAKEYIGAGVRINAISPGPCDTPMSMLPGETEAGRSERLSTALPIGRVATLGEVASSVLWLASSESGYAVGLDLVIDGGSRA